MIKQIISPIGYEEFPSLSLILSWWKTFQLKQQPNLLFLNMLFFVPRFQQHSANISNCLDKFTSSSTTVAITNFYGDLKKGFLVAAVYGSLATVLLQFIIAIYLLCNMILPNGFIFLITCMSFMACIYGKCCVFFHFEITKNKSNTIVAER